jgi:small subunit ribosomal protein S3
VIRTWESKWYEKKDYATWLHEDIKLRAYILKKLTGSGVAKVEIERAAKKVKVSIYASRPGIIIGKKGAGIDSLKADLQRITSREVVVAIQEVRKAEINSTLVAESVAQQLERRVAFRRAMKKAISQAMKFGAKGIKIRLSGRLAGADIARSETYKEGSVPLHTLRADVDYGTATASTTYGQIGVKVWIYKGEVLPQVGGKKSLMQAAAAAGAQT